MKRARARRAASRRGKTEAEDTSEQAPSNEEQDEEEEEAANITSKPAAGGIRRSTRARRLTEKAKGQESIVSYVTKRVKKTTDDEEAENDESSSDESAKKESSNNPAAKRPRRSKHKRAPASSSKQDFEREEDDDENDEAEDKNDEQSSSDESSAKKESGHTRRLKRKRPFASSSKQDFDEDENDEAEGGNAEQLSSGESSANKETGPTRRSKRRRKHPAALRDDSDNEEEDDHHEEPQDNDDQSSSDHSSAKKEDGPARRSKRKRAPPSSLKEDSESEEEDENDEAEEENGEQSSSDHSSTKEENSRARSRRSKRKGAPPSPIPESSENEEEDERCVKDTDNNDQESKEEKVAPSEKAPTSSPIRQRGSDDSNKDGNVDEQDIAEKEGMRLSKPQQDQVDAEDGPSKDELDDEQYAGEKAVSGFSRPQQDGLNVEDEPSKEEQLDERDYPEKEDKSLSNSHQDQAYAEDEPSKDEHADDENSLEKEDAPLSKPKDQIDVEDELSKDGDGGEQDDAGKGDERSSKPQHDQVEAEGGPSKSKQVQISSVFDMLAAVCGKVQPAPVDSASETAIKTAKASEEEVCKVDPHFTQVDKAKDSSARLRGKVDVKARAVTASPESHSPARTAPSELVEKKESDHTLGMKKELHPITTDNDSQVKAFAEKKEWRQADFGSLFQPREDKGEKNIIRQSPSRLDREEPSVASALISLASVAADATINTKKDIDTMDQPPAKQKEHYVNDHAGQEESQEKHVADESMGQTSVSLLSENRKEQDDNGNGVQVESQEEIADKPDAAIPAQTDKGQLLNETKNKSGPFDLGRERLSDEIKQRAIEMPSATEAVSASSKLAEDASKDTPIEPAKDETDATCETTSFQGQKQQREVLKIIQGGETHTIEHTGEQKDSEQFSAGSLRVQPQQEQQEKMKDSNVQKHENQGHESTEQMKEEQRVEREEEKSKDTNGRKDQEHAREEAEIELNKTQSICLATDHTDESSYSKKFKAVEEAKIAVGDDTEHEKSALLEKSIEAPVDSTNNESGKQQGEEKVQTPAVRRSTPNGEKESAPELIDGHESSSENSALKVNESVLSCESTCKLETANVQVSMVKEGANREKESGEKISVGASGGNAEIASGEHLQKRKRDDDQSDHEETAMDEPKRRDKTMDDSFITSLPENGNKVQEHRADLSNSELQEAENKRDEAGSCDRDTSTRDSLDKEASVPQHATNLSPEFLAIQASLPELERFKMRLYAAGARVYRGRGAERRFAEYWNALARYIAVRVSGREVNASRGLDDARDVLESFLSTKQLRKLHNKLIMALMERCLHQHVIAVDLQRHVPQHWRKRTKSRRVLEKTTQPAETTSLEQSSAQFKPVPGQEYGVFKPWAGEFGVNSAVWSAGGISERAPYGPPAITVPDVSYLSDGQHMEAGPGSSELTSYLPGALSIERLTKDIAASQGIGVASNTVWLLVIAVREYTASILKNTISGMESLGHDQILPQELIAQPILHSVKNGQTKPASRKPTIKGDTESFSSSISPPASPRKLTYPGDRKRRCISPMDIATVLASAPLSVGASLGGSTSRLAFERCYASAYSTSPESCGQDFDVVNGFVSSCIRSVPQKRQKLVPDAGETAIIDSVDSHAMVIETAAPDNAVAFVPRMPRPAVLSRRTSSGMGRGAKNLAALRARAVTKPPEESSASQNTQGNVTGANALPGPHARVPQYVPPSSTPREAAIRNLASSSNTMVPIPTNSTPVIGGVVNESTSAGDQPAGAQLPNATLAEKRVESPGVRGGRGFGTKNLAAIRARSVTKEDKTTPGVESAPPKQDTPAGVEGGAAAPQKLPESAPPAKRAEGKQQAAASVIGGKQLNLLRLAEERRKHLDKEASTASVQPNTASVSEHNVEQVLSPSTGEGPKETVLAPAVHVHGNADGTG